MPHGGGSLLVALELMWASDHLVSLLNCLAFQSNNAVPHSLEQETLFFLLFIGYNFYLIYFVFSFVRGCFFSVQTWGILL